MGMHDTGGRTGMAGARAARARLACAALLMAIALLAANLAGCATPGSVALPDGPPGSVVEVGAGVYVVRGAPGEVSPDNLGRLGNAGFVVGDDGVVAIDTGTSYRHGVALLEAIGRVTDKPVRLALVTHTRPEFIFGAAAFQARGIPVRMHEDAARLMAARCEVCLARLRRALGDQAMRDTVVFKPDATFGESHRLDLIGRPIRVLAYGLTSGPGSVAVLDERSGVLFAGGLLDNGRIPDVRDAADLSGWRQALAALRAVPARVVVPGHGPAGRPARVVDGVERYLAQLDARVRELLRAGAGLGEVPQRAALPAFQDWDGYATVHRDNAMALFTRLERAQVVR